MTPIVSRKAWPWCAWDKVGNINTSGKIVINPQFDVGSRFIGGNAFVAMSGHQGTINKNGQYVINPGSIGSTQLPARRVC